MAPAHVAAYAEFGAWITGCYKKAPLASASLAAGAASVTLPLPAGAQPDRVVLREDQTGGQFVITYAVEAQVGGAWAPFSAGTTIGSNRIDVCAAGPAAGATALRLTILSAFSPGHAGVHIDVLDGAGCATQ